MSTTTFPISLEVCEPYATRPGHRDVRLGVVALAEVLPDATTRLLAELALEEVEELRAAHLVATSRTEDRADEPADCDDVVPRPRSDRETCLAVLRVDARDVRVDDPDCLRPLRTLRTEECELLCEPGLGLRARPEQATRERKPEGVDPRRVDCRDASRAAEELHDQLPVGCRRPPRAEGDVLGRLPFDVGNSPPVARDRDACAGPFELDRTLAGGDAEGLPFEEAAQIGGLDVVAQSRETLVERDLVGRIPGECDAARLPGREHVPCLGGVIHRRRRAERCGGDRGARSGRNEESS